MDVLKKIWNVLSTALVTFQGHWGTSSRCAAYNGNGGSAQGYIAQQEQQSPQGQTPQQEQAEAPEEEQLQEQQPEDDADPE